MRTFPFTRVAYLKRTKSPAIWEGLPVGFHYADLVQGQDYRPPGWKYGRGYVCSETSRLAVADVDRPQEFPNTKLGQILSREDAYSYNPFSDHFHIYLDMRGYRGDWPVQGPRASGVYDIKSNGFVRAAPAYHKIEGSRLTLPTAAIIEALEADAPVRQPRELDGLPASELIESWVDPYGCYPASAASVLKYWAGGSRERSLLPRCAKIKEMGKRGVPGMGALLGDLVKAYYEQTGRSARDVLRAFERASDGQR
jgi:hypothetical protein